MTPPDNKPEVTEAATHLKAALTNCEIKCGRLSGLVVKGQAAHAATVEALRADLDAARKDYATFQESVLDLSHPNFKPLLDDKTRLTAEIERWRESNIRFRDEMEHQAALNLELTLDKERLDWLETCELVVAGGQWSNGCLERGQKLWWDAIGGNLRTAIDAARKAAG